VIAVTPQSVVAVFAIFCRIGGCLLIAPGFSSQHVPVRVRLYVALAASLAMTPLLIDGVRPAVGDGAGPAILGVLFSETATGLLIGFVARIFFVALQFITVAMTQAIGLSALPGTAVEDNDQVPALSTLYTTTATTLMFVAGLHTELLRGLIDSYRAIPPGGVFAARVALVDIADQTSAAFVTALRIGSPFVVYSIVVNFAIGVTNKLTPQIPIYFIATPFVLIGGLFLLALTVRDFFGTFQAAFTSWLING
jgi:flagellar biosynthetic protein FliR